MPPTPIFSSDIVSLREAVLATSIMFIVSSKGIQNQRKGGTIA